MQDSRRRIWLDAQSQRLDSFAELNAWLAERCRLLWAELRHPEHKEFSVAEMLELRPHRPGDALRESPDERGKVSGAS